MLPRNLDSWVDGFLRYTEGISSPKIFRKWTALATIGAALERRVWVQTAKGFTFPNLFAILVGRPGIGKTEAINAGRALVRATHVQNVFEQACHLAPTDVTKGALLDYLADASVLRRCLDPLASSFGKDEQQPYHSAFLAISELGNLIRENDTHLLPILCDLFDCPQVIEEERRYRADKPIKIPRAQLSFLGGTTPAHLSQAFPPIAWDQGFMARTILVYSSEMVEPDLFNAEAIDLELAQLLIKDLRAIGKMVGKMTFTDEVKVAIRSWQKSGQEPKPKHIRLEHYCTRRLRHVLKLSMIAAADKANQCLVDVEDFQQGLAWLIEVEDQMPQIFMEMTGSSDGKIMDELYYYVLQLWESPLHGKKPIRKGFLINFLRHRVVEWRIEKIIETAAEAEILVQCPVDGEIRYRPNLEIGLFRQGKKKT